MNQLPFGYQVNARVSGTPALCAIFAIGFLTMFGLAIGLLPSGVVKNTLIGIAVVGFVGIAIFCCYIILAKPDRFSLKDEQHIKIERTQTFIIKMLEQAPKASTMEPSSPVNLLPEDSNKKEKRS